MALVLVKGGKHRMAEEIIISGVIESVIFKNDENGYAVLKLRLSDGGEEIAVGCVPYAGVGEFIEATGTRASHPTYGEQFKISAFRRARPNSAAMILEYLSSGTIRGIGRKTAEKIVGLFGDDSLYIIEHEPKRLCEIAGITAQKAEKIGKEFEMQNSLSLLMEFLSENGLEPNVAVTLFRLYGKRANELVRSNPYLLSGAEVGVAFYKVDALAINMGFGGNSKERIDAAILYELRYNSEAGHSFIPRDKLCAVTAQLISVDYDEVDAEISALEREGEVVLDEICGVNACYLTKLYEAEKFVARKLAEMSLARADKNVRCDELIDKVQSDCGIEFEPLQKRAIEAAVNNSVLLLTGGPGTGKTTVIRGMLSAFRRMNMRVLLAAPTGRAAKRMSEFCGDEAKTIHRLLEICYSDEAMSEAVFTRDETNPLETDVLIIDEMSMVDVNLISATLHALPRGCKIVLVGDADQLPSVGPGNVFKDLLNSQMFETVSLDKIFRQAAKSDIIVGAHAVNRGDMPDFRKRDNDLFYIKKTGERELIDTVLELCRERLPKNMNIPSSQIQVLSVSRKNATGTVELNRELQRVLNPSGEDKNEKKIGDKLFRVGDRVMQIKNNYTINWFGMFGGEVGCGIFNGDIGEVVGIDDRDETLTVNFDSRLVHYPFSQLDELELAYAMTVHKSQGSEFRAVILVACDGAPMLLHRSVLYTAMTRARELLVIVGDYGVVKYMVGNNKQRNRYSALRARIVALLS